MGAVGIALAAVCAVLLAAIGLGGAMIYEERNKTGDLVGALIVTGLALALAFLAGWLAQGLS